MNNFDWEAHQRLQRNQNHPQTVNTNCGPCPWMRNAGSSYTYPGEEAHSSSRGSNMGLSGPAFSNQHRMEAESEDPDGEPLEEDDDPELARKRKELSEIQDRILHKRVSIALKTVEKLETPHTNHMMTTRKRLSLRGRVNDLLKLRRSLSLSKSLTQRPQPSGLCGDALPVEDHPLKLRVEALMRRRHDDLPLNSQIGDGPCAPPSPGPSVPAVTQEDNVNQGFQRFLTLLNKGMDLDLLSRIVNDDSDELAPGDALLDSTLPPITSHGETGRCSGGAQQRDGSGGGERTADPLSQDPSADNGKSPSHDEAKTDDSGNCSLGSSRRSKSPPPPAAEKKRRKTEAEKPLLGDQHRQLQNILSTLGLSLGPEEMSKMTDRTQERLYGRREGRAAAERESPTSAVSPRRYRSSSSSSSSSSTSSKSPSQSLSPSPQNSHERAEKSKRSCSRDKSAQTSRGGSRGAERAEGHAEGHAQGHAWCEGANFGKNPFYQDQQFHPAAASSFYPGYGLDSHGAEHADYGNGTYGDARHPYWTYPQGHTPAHPYSQDDYRYAESWGAHGWLDADGPPHGCFNPPVNPDLSQSEGQRGSLYRTCCLLPVHGGEASVQKTTVKAPTNAAPTLPNPKKKKKGKKKRMAKEAWLARQREACLARQRKAWLVCERNKMMMREQKLKYPIERQCIAVPLNEVATPSGTEAAGPAPSQAKPPLQSQEPPEKEERELTEEEIKANLRKKLEAFNQMARKKSQSQQNP